MAVTYWMDVTYFMAVTYYNKLTIYLATKYKEPLKFYEVKKDR